MKQVITGVAGLTALAVMASVASAATLDDVKAKGFVQCGVNTGLAGFSAPDAKGEWAGLDADFCRAVAAAVEAPPCPNSGLGGAPRPPHPPRR